MIKSIEKNHKTNNKANNNNKDKNKDNSNSNSNPNSNLNKNKNNNKKKSIENSAGNGKIDKIEIGIDISASNEEWKNQSQSITKLLSLIDANLKYLIINLPFEGREMNIGWDRQSNNTKKTN